MPTVVPMTAFSATSSAAASVSVGTVTSNSSTSLMVILNDLAGDRTVAAGSFDRDRASRSVCFAIDGDGRRDHTGVGIDREQSIGVAGQAVRDRVVGRIQIEGIGGDADRGADDGIFGDFVGGCVNIRRHGDIELIDIVDRDVERLAGDRSVAAGRLDRDRTSCTVGFAVDGCGRRHDAGVGIDCEQAIGVAGQAVRDRVVGRVQIECIGRDADRGTDDRILGRLRRSCVNVCRRRDIKLIHIVDRDVERLAGDRSVAAGRFDRDRTGRSVVSRSIAAAVVTTPVLASIVNSPSGLLVRL